MFEPKLERNYSYVLPEDQEMIVEAAKQLAERLGFAVRVVDVTKENVFTRLLREEFKKIAVFPTVVTDSGARAKSSLRQVFDSFSITCYVQSWALMTCGRIMN
jgi:hypothetical protein